MRKAFLILPALIAACTANPPVSASADSSDPTPVHGVTPGHKCTTEGTARFIGQTGNDETGNAILKASNAAVLRWAPPGVMLTMDYREDRVTISLDAARKITQIRCG